MQEGDRPIEFGLRGFDAGHREVDGAELFGGELVVVMFVRTGERGGQENRRTQTGHPAHRASDREPSYGESRHTGPRRVWVVSVQRVNGGYGVNATEFTGKRKGRPAGR